MDAASHSVYVFIDAGYLRSDLEEIGVDWARIDLRAVANGAIQAVDTERWKGRPMVLSRTFIYDAVEHGRQKGALIERWLDLNRQGLDTHVRWGRMAGDSGSTRRRQKAVDVQLAVDAVSWAARSAFEVALLITGDADFIPAAEAVREHGPLVAVVGFRRSLSPDLRQSVDRVGWLPGDIDSWNGWMFPS